MTSNAIVMIFGSRQKKVECPAGLGFASPSFKAGENGTTITTHSHRPLHRHRITTALGSLNNSGNNNLLPHSGHNHLPPRLLHNHKHRTQTHNGRSATKAPWKTRKGKNFKSGVKGKPKKWGQHGPGSTHGSGADQITVPPPEHRITTMCKAMFQNIDVVHLSFFDGRDKLFNPLAKACNHHCTSRTSRC